MKLVDYLRALLSQFVSKKDTNFIVKQCNIKDLVSTEQIPVNQEISRVSPTDGYAELLAEGAVYTDVRLTAAIREMFVASGGGLIRRTHIPVNKGQRILAEAHTNDPSPRVLLNFFGKVGGG